MGYLGPLDQGFHLSCKAVPVSSCGYNFMEATTLLHLLAAQTATVKCLLRV